MLQGGNSCWALEYCIKKAKATAGILNIEHKETLDRFAACDNDKYGYSMALYSLIICSKFDMVLKEFCPPEEEEAIADEELVWPPSHQQPEKHSKSPTYAMRTPTSNSSTSRATTRPSTQASTSSRASSPPITTTKPTKINRNTTSSSTSTTTKTSSSSNANSNSNHKPASKEKKRKLVEGVDFPAVRYT